MAKDDNKVGEVKISSHASGQINITTKGEPVGNGTGTARAETCSSLKDGYVLIREDVLAEKD